MNNETETEQHEYTQNVTYPPMKTAAVVPSPDARKKLSLTAASHGVLDIYVAGEISLQAAKDVQPYATLV